MRIDFISNVSDNRGGQYYPSWFNNVLKVGDEERGPDGRVSAKILKKIVINRQMKGLNII